MQHQVQTEVELPEITAATLRKGNKIQVDLKTHETLELFFEHMTTHGIQVFSFNRENSFPLDYMDITSITRI